MAVQNRIDVHGMPPLHARAADQPNSTHHTLYNSELKVGIDANH